MTDIMISLQKVVAQKCTIPYIVLKWAGSVLYMVL